MAAVEASGRVAAVLGGDQVEPQGHQEGGGEVKPRTVAWTAWSAWALLAGLAILLQTPTAEGYSTPWVPAALGLGSFMTVGAVVVSRQPHNRIGWLCCAAGLLGVLAAFSGEYTRYAPGPHGGSLPGGLAMAWLNGWVGTLWAGLVLSFLLLLFPTGRLPSRRWGGRSPGPARSA